MFVTDNLGQNSDVRTMSVSREVDSQPLMLEITRHIPNWDPDRMLKMKAAVRKSACTDTDIEKLVVRADGFVRVIHSTSFTFVLLNVNHILVPMGAIGSEWFGHIISN